MKTGNKGLSLINSLEGMTAKDRIKELQRTVGANPDGILGNETLTKFQCHFKGNLNENYRT